MKGVDLKQIIHRHYFGTEIKVASEMKVDEKGQVAYHGKRASEFRIDQITVSERDKEVDTTRKVAVMLEYHIFSCHQHISSPTSGTNIFMMK